MEVVVEAPLHINEKRSRAGPLAPSTQADAPPALAAVSRSALPG
jgi:hypothetical protein